MATTKPAVRIPVRLDTKDAKKEAKNFSRSMRQSFQGVGDIVQATRLAFDMARASLGKLTAITKEAVALAAEQERVEHRVMTIANIKGEFSKADFKRLQENNAARQQALGIGDEEQLKMQSTALMLGARAESLNTITEATIGLSKATGRDLFRAMKQVMAIRSGEFTMLEAMGVQVKTTGEAMEWLSQKYIEAAAQTGTWSQATDTLNANWGDFMERLGESFIKNEDVKELLADINREVIELGDYIVDNKAAIHDGISTMVQDLRNLGTWIGQNTEGIKLLASLFVGAKALGAAGGVWGAIRGLGAAGGAGVAGLAGLTTRAVGGIVAGMGAGSVSFGPERTHEEKQFESIMASYADPAQGMAAALAWMDSRGGAAAGAAKGPITVEPTTIYGPGRREVERDKKARERAAKRAALKRRRAEEEERGAWDRYYEEQGGPLDSSWGGQYSAMDRGELEKIENEAKWQEARDDWKAEQRQREKDQETQFWGEMASIGVAGISGMFHGIAAAAAGQADLGQILQKQFSSMLQEFGSYLITMGSAALAANAAASLVPMLWPYTGGPPGVGAALGIIAAGTGLLAGGMLMAPSTQGVKSAGRSVQRDARRSRRTETASGPGGGERAPVMVKINFNAPVTSPRRTARAISDILLQGRTLSPGFGG